MGILERIKLYISVTESEDIIRRYFFNSTFDCSLTTLGIIFGVHANTSDAKIILAAVFGAVIATFTSGLTSAYLSEVSEKKVQLREIQDAMLNKLSKSLQVQASKIIPIIIAIINGLAPVIASTIIVSPYILSVLGYITFKNLFLYSVFIALGIILFLGAFLGKISGESIFSSSIKTISIALFTMVLIYFLSLTNLL